MPEPDLIALQKEFFHDLVNSSACAEWLKRRVPVQYADFWKEWCRWFAWVPCTEKRARLLFALLWGHYKPELLEHLSKPKVQRWR